MPSLTVPVLADPIEARLEHLRARDALGQLAAVRRGLEKESLRIDGNGVLAQTPHPPALGSALTHPYITTDYSEALLEFVTPVFTDIGETLRFLTDIHRFAYQNIDAEKLWTSSMPCILLGEASIPIARYGTSNIGRMKHVYRVGLAHRYGKLMQTIAGIHYNFSLPDGFWIRLLGEPGPEQRRDAKSRHYFALVRNFHRRCWLLLYLLGASPAVCRSFLAGRSHSLTALGDNSFHAPWATCLRMSDLGYHNDAQAAVQVCYNELDRYVESLQAATGTPYRRYQEIGVRAGDEYRQLNANLLQIENEYYSVIRPKRVTRSGERPSRALAERGVEYVEVRCIDLDPFLAIGIDAATVRFLDVFLLGCLLDDSPAIDGDEQKRIDENRMRTVLRGREPGLALAGADRAVRLRDEARVLLERLAPIAAALDEAAGGNRHEVARLQQMERVEDPDATPSARILAEMIGRGESFFEFSMRKAGEHEAFFRSEPLADDIRRTFEEVSAQSLADQAAIEAADDVDFEEFLRRYFAQ